MRPAGILLDENVSARLRTLFGVPAFHLKDWEGGIKDSALWRRATEEPWVIVTQDSDLTERMLAQEPPPWVVHVRTGNMLVADFRALMNSAWPEVWAFLEDHKLVIVYRDHIEAVKRDE